MTLHGALLSLSIFAIRLPPNTTECKDSFLSKLDAYADTVAVKEGDAAGPNAVCSSICYRILRETAEQEAQQHMKPLVFDDYADIRNYCGYPLRCEDYSGIFYPEPENKACDGIEKVKQDFERLETICESIRGCIWTGASVSTRRIAKEERATPYPYDQYACKCDTTLYSTSSEEQWTPKIEPFKLATLPNCANSPGWCKCGTNTVTYCAAASCVHHVCSSRTILLFLFDSKHLGMCEGRATSLLHINKELCRTSLQCGFHLDGGLLSCKDCQALPGEEECVAHISCEWHRGLQSCFPYYAVADIGNDGVVPGRCAAVAKIAPIHGSGRCEDYFGCEGPAGSCKEVCPSTAFACVGADARCTFSLATRTCVGPTATCASFTTYCMRIVQREWCRTQAHNFDDSSLSLPTDCFLQVADADRIPRDFTARVVTESIKEGRRVAFVQARSHLDDYCKRWDGTIPQYGCTSDRVVQVEAEMRARAQFRQMVFAECERLQTISPSHMRPRIHCDEKLPTQQVMRTVINRQRRLEYHRTRLSELMVLLSEPYTLWSISGDREARSGQYNIPATERFFELLAGKRDLCFAPEIILPGWISDYYLLGITDGGWTRWKEQGWREKEKRILRESLRTHPWSHECLQGLAEEVIRLLHVAARSKVRIKDEIPDDFEDETSGRAAILNMVHRLQDAFVMRTTSFPFAYMVETFDMAIVVCQVDKKYEIKDVIATHSVKQDVARCADGLVRWLTNTEDGYEEQRITAEEAHGINIGKKLAEKEEFATSKLSWSSKLAIQFMKSMLIAHDRVFPLALQDEEIHEKIFALYIYLVRSEEHSLKLPRQRLLFQRFISIVFPDAIAEVFVSLVTFLNEMHDIPLIFEYGFEHAELNARNASERIDIFDKNQLTKSHQRLARRSSQHVPLFVIEFLLKDGHHWFFQNNGVLSDEYRVADDSEILASTWSGGRSVIEVLEHQQLAFPRYDMRLLLYFKLNWASFMAHIEKWPNTLLVYTNDYYLNRLRQDKMVEQFTCDLLLRDKVLQSDDSYGAQRETLRKRQTILDVVPYYPNYHHRQWQQWKKLESPRCSALDLMEIIPDIMEAKRKFHPREEDEQGGEPEPGQAPSQWSTMVAHAWPIVLLVLLLALVLALGVFIWRMLRQSAQTRQDPIDPGTQHI